MNADRDRSEEPRPGIGGQVQPPKSVAPTRTPGHPEQPAPPVPTSGAAREATKAQVPRKEQYAAAREAMGKRGWNMPELAHDIANAVVAAGPVDAELAAVGVQVEWAGEATLAKLRTLADEWDAAAKRYWGYAKGSLIPAMHRGVSTSLTVNAKALRAILAANPAPEPQADSKPGQNLEVEGARVAALHDPAEEYATLLHEVRWLRSRMDDPNARLDFIAADADQVLARHAWYVATDGE